MSTQAQILGHAILDWLKTVRNLSIYCGYLADTTKAWNEKNSCGMTAKQFYDVIQQPITV